MSADAFTRQIEAAHQRLLDLEQRASGSTDQPSVTIEALEELSTAMEELHVAAEELRQQNEELAAARYIAEAERQRYQELFEFAPDGYLVTDPEGIIREANRAASALLGVRQDFLIGKPLLVFVAEQDQQTFHTRLTQLHTTDVISRDLPRLEIMLQPRDGEPFPVSLTVGLVRDADSQLVGLRWLLRDITERVQAGKELGWLASFPKLNPNPVIEVDLSGHVGYLNPAAKRLFPDLIAGSQHPWLAGLEGLAERFRTETLSSIQREITLGKACYEQTLHYVAEQQRVRIYGFDITERKQAERALEEYSHDLNERVKELDCLYSISEMVRRNDISQGELLQASVHILALAYQFPEITACRITWGEHGYSTEDFQETPWSQNRAILVHGEQVGTIQVCYLEERPKEDEGPFLAEERNLVNAVAVLLGGSIERKQAEEELRESEERFRLAINATREGLWEWDIQTNQEFFAPRWCEIIGYSSDDPELPHTYNSWASRIHPDDYDRVMSALNNHLEKGTPYDVDYRHRHKSGEYRWQNSRGQAVFDESGKPTKMVGGISDITDRKRMEEALRKAHDELEVRVKERTLDLVKANEELQTEIASREQAQAARRETEAMFRTLTETTSAAIFITHGFHILYANPAATTITGYTSDELMDMPIWAIAHPTYQGLLQQRGVANQWLDNVPSRYELKIVTKDSEERWLDITAGSIQFEGQPASVMTAFDITERDRVEKALQKAKQDLEVRVAERTAELQQANVELQARNEALDAFAQTVAHDLKNLLNIILGYAEELAARDASLRADERLAYLQNIASGARKLNIITDELMLVAEVHNLEAVTEPLHMATIVDEAQQRLTKLIETYQAEINLHEPSAWPIAVGHDSWIEEVWVNYLSNALKYGGRPPRIELGAQPQADGMVRFWIHDNGSGLTPADQTRLFAPFTRLNRARGLGHGLGLSIVRRIVEKIGGQVGVESQLGQGSTFFFTLPAAGRQHLA